MHRRSKTYRFADEMISQDTAISYILSCLSLIFTIIAVILSTAKKGQADSVAGALVLSAIISLVTSIIFLITSIRNPSGSSRSKRVSIGLIVAAAAPIVLIILSSKN